MGHTREESTLHGQRGLVLTIPNPHRQVIEVDLLQRILRRANISREEWLGSEL